MTRSILGRAPSAWAELRPALLIGLALPGAAFAFCGTYVGGTGDQLTNRASEVAIVRVGGHTVLSLANDVHGDTEDFALVIPVPEVIAEDRVHVLDHGVFDRLDAYSEPRLVRYTCDDFAETDADADADSDADSDVDADTDADVEVEAEYVVGEYQIAVLSAVESKALFEWLNANGYVVPQQSVGLLQDYIDGGSYFLAARVAPEAQIASGDRLSPLQIAYDSDAYALPVRIGTLNADGAQDLVVYAINRWHLGAVGVANYPEVALEDDCLWDGGGQSFGDFYAEAFNGAHEQARSAIWMQEYAWGQGDCDPCSGPAPDTQDLVTLGLADGGAYADWYFTRLHLRYTPDEVGQDLVLYHSNVVAQEQQRYIEYLPELEDRFPICGVGEVDDPGSCTDGSRERPNGVWLRGVGCAAVPQAGGASLLLLAAALAAARLGRRRG